jgi:hypothetical protein
MSVNLLEIAGLVGTDYVSLSPANGFFASAGNITFQALFEETHTDTLEVTDSPVEAGAQITDHSFMRPFEVVIRCGWSNSSLQGLIGGITNVINAAQALVSGSQPTQNDYVSSVYSQLQALQQSRQLFSIQTTLRYYTNMLITSLEVVRDEKTAKALMVTATCRQVILTQLAKTVTPVQLSAPELPQNLQMPDINFPKNAPPINYGTSNLIPGNPAPAGSLPPAVWSPTALSAIGTGGFGPAPGLGTPPAAPSVPPSLLP